MASLALKAISYGAERIPDKFFEAIPGGYFKAQEEKDRKRRKKDKERAKRRTQSEGHGRRQRRSSSPEESDYYTDDYYTDESDRERRRRNRRVSDADRGRERGRERDRDHKHRHYHHDLDQSHYHPDRSRSTGAPKGLHIPPPPVQPAAAFPPAVVAGENYAHPQPYNATHNHHYATKPYNPADYAPGAMQTSTPDYPNGQPALVNPHAPLQPVPPVHAPNGGYYGTQFPPPPPGSRSSRASSVDSRGLQAGPYIPHSNIQAAPSAPATVGVPGHSPYAPSFPSAANTPPYSNTPPQYRPQNSSPYQPNYSPGYPPQQPMLHGSQPVSRQGSIRSSTVHGGQVGDGRRTHGRHRRHSIATNQDPRMPYRNPYRSGAGSSATSASNSVRGSVADAIHEVGSQADGVDDCRPAVAIIVPAETAGTVVGAAQETFSAPDALRKRHRVRSDRRFHGGRRAATASKPANDYDSA
ncbi:hypothetical protein B0J12DRAFT_72546 [Macrophomina phaseolina]|uniref:Uncharacterized protein n=1 Tax=Macrophomina phaseolina TaxID=35725 RepID=A0ABQ8GDY3_9PEZI|nr:hypothetical protein B0J12DRAFT_72546 [Macrophomina phaseolina]